MKKYNKFGYAGALLLAGLVSFSACSSDDELADVNPNYNPETETVKTQFAISVPYAGKSGRMSAEMTQQDGNNFRGIENIWLLPLTTSGVTGNEALNGEILSLGKFGMPSFNITNDQNKVQVYENVNVKRGTNRFLFYGLAPSTVSATADNKFAEGVLTTTLTAKSTSVSDATYSLSPCFDNTEWSTQTANLLAGLNGVLTQLIALEGIGSLPEGEKADYTEVLKRFKGLKSGSAASVKATLVNLAGVMDALYDKYTGRQSEIQKVKDAIYKVDGTALLNASKEWKTGLVAADFPAKHNIPDGAVALNLAGGEQSFEIATTNNMGQSTALTLDRAKICYPAALAYFIETPIRCKSGETVSGDFTNLWSGSDGAWNGSNNTTWKGTEVDLTTTGIALENRIQYGVANLVTTFTCKHDDKDAALQLAANQLADRNPAHKITINVDGFPVNAVLVGGQPKTVKWDFTDGAAVKDHVIYDKTLTSINAKNDVVSQNNYTLVLDNTHTANNPVINIAVEFTNNSGSDIYGVDGIIPDGAKFYLVAKLNPASPNNANANKNGEVFQKDFKTIANMTITNLKNAYNVIPDLRSSELSLGMAVDLKWQAGMEFNVDFE